MNKSAKRCLLAIPLCTALTAWSRGVTPYLPLNLSPEIERQIERVLLLGDQPVMRKPIAAATVLKALPKACERDAQVCTQVENYLRKYMDNVSVQHVRIGAAAMDGESRQAIPNAHGMLLDNEWHVIGKAHYQMNDYLLVNAGIVADQIRTTPTNTFLSAGWSFAQLDVGYRDHWLSPFSDSSTLISTEAPTMPSITLSNYEPISPLGLGYELFIAELSHQTGIAHPTGPTEGKPRLASAHFALAPINGYAVAVTKLRQYGGGARGGRNLSDFVDALTSTSNKADINGEEGANQVVSITSSIIFPGSVPFGVHMEYAGEDNAYKPDYRLGAINLSLGIDFPKLGEHLDATYEISEWQNDWYIHSLYPQGLTNKGFALGHWFGDQRRFGDAIAGMSHSLKIGWRPTGNHYLRATYRTLAYYKEGSRALASLDYQRMHIATLNWSSTWRSLPFDVEIGAGQDVFGHEFARLAGSIDFAARTHPMAVDHRSYDSHRNTTDSTELFLDFGATHGNLRRVLITVNPRTTPRFPSDSVHIGVGARRIISQRHALGARIEYDEIAGYRLLSLRALDYRFSMFPKFALNAFLGFARYDIDLPSNGYYVGAGVQYLDVLPRWDIGFDARHYEKINRDAVFPYDPLGHPRVYFDLSALTLYVTRRW